MGSHDEGPNRRKVLECMTWAGTGVLWTIAGGVPRSMGLVGEATAAEPAGRTGGSWALTCCTARFLAIPDPICYPTPALFRGPGFRSSPARAVVAELVDAQR